MQADPIAEQTNYISYFFKGVDSVPDVHHRHNHDQDRIEVTAPSHEYKGTTAFVPGQLSPTFLVDNAVQIQTVDNVVRQNAQEEWNRLKTHSDKTFTATLITGIVAVAAGIVLGIAAFTFPPLIFGAIPAFIVGVTLLVGTGVSNSKSNTAQEELDKWQDPVATVQQHRRNAAFTYIYKNKLKGDYFHEQEVKTLWYDHVQKYENILHLEYNAPAINKFFCDNPLANGAVNYAFGDNVPEDVRDTSVCFEAVNGQYLALKRETNERKDRINKEKRRAIGVLEAQRDSQLAPIVRIYRERYNQLNQRRAPLIANQRGLNLRHQNELQRLNASMAENERDYQRLRAPVDAWFNRESGRVEYWASNMIRGIENDHNDQLLKFHDPIQIVIKGYSFLKDGSIYDAVPQADELLEDIQFADPSAPEPDKMVEVNQADFDAYQQPPVNQ
jgi:hypothetical protein